MNTPEELDKLLLELRELDGKLAIARAGHSLRYARLEESHRLELAPSEARRAELLRAIKMAASAQLDDVQLTHGAVVHRVHPVEVVFDHGAEAATKLLLEIGRHDLLHISYTPKKELIRGLGAATLRELGVRVIRRLSLVVKVTDGDELVWPLGERT